MNAGFKSALIVLLLGASPLLRAQFIAPYLEQVNYNSNIDYLSSGNISTRMNDVLIDDIFTFPDSVANPEPVRQLRGAQINGFHIDAQFRTLFTLDNHAQISGVAVGPGDIFRCNNGTCSSVSVVFSLNAFTDRPGNVDAFTFDPETGELIFSIETAMRINGSSFFPADLIRYDGAAGFSLDYDAINSTSGIGADGNVTGLSMMSNRKYAVILDQDREFTGIFHRRYFVLELTPETHTWFLTYTPLSLGEGYAAAHLQSLMVRENDLIFRNSFD